MRERCGASRGKTDIAGSKTLERIEYRGVYRRHLDNSVLTSLDQSHPKRPEIILGLVVRSHHHHFLPNYADYRSRNAPERSAKFPSIPPDDAHEC
jgi:hypothetical protein